MNSVLKKLGLACAVSLMLGAVGAGAAGAAEFHSELETTWLYSTSSSGVTIATEPGSMNCSSSSSLAGIEKGRGEGTDWHTKSVSVNPTYSCTLGGQNVVSTTTGCAFGISATSAAQAAATISCEAGKKLTFAVPSGNCSFSIEPQTPGGSGVSIKKEGAGASRSEVWTLSMNVVYTVEGPGTYCGVLGKHTGTISGVYSMKGFSNAAHTIQRGIWTAEGGGDVTLGVFVGGGTPMIESETYPRAIAGTQGPVLKLTTPAGYVKCLEGQFSGLLSSATAELPLSAAFTGCVAFGQKAAIDMKSCKYVLEPTAGPPYTGKLRLACSEPNDAVVITVGSFCSVSLPAQTLGAASLENRGSGSGRYIVVTVNGENLAYSVTVGSLCGTPAAHTDGSFSGGLEI